MTKRLSTAMAVLSLTVLALTGCGTSATTSSGTMSAPAAAGANSAPAASAAPADLATATTVPGNIVVNGKGMSVYVFDKDVKDSGKSACTGACQTIWPAVTAGSGTPVVEGVSGKIGVITTDTGTKQVTLNGMPLYLFADDATPGDVKGQGFNKIWWVISPAGEKISTPAA
ncbi:COG4315 family predicted lipoprotein [Pseudarthrobacter sp. P1]|uniref:COG4315 family predicted lipoprotein n=1 Tax=Pseudarthrobacter sp. P1 TaxID=3418418 RepID=UPI003CF06E8E